MGPSVKFVSPNKGLISKKNGGQFFSRKNDQTRGGGSVRGGFGKRTYFFTFFFEPFPYEVRVLPVTRSLLIMMDPNIQAEQFPGTTITTETMDSLKCQKQGLLVDIFFFFFSENV